VLCCSCDKKQPVGDHPVLKVELTERPVSVLDIFDKVEIIPLETSEASLFSRIDKVEFYENTFYIHSMGAKSVFMFDPEGRYVNKIQRIGRGPGEYTEAYDFVLHPTTGTISILNPWGSILNYDLEGNFIVENELPHPPPAYRYFEMLDEDTYVTWSRCREDETGVNIVNADTFEINHGFFSMTSIWGGHRWGSTFHKYNGDVYYHESMRNVVYRIKADGYGIAYEWDTGVEIIDPKMLQDPNNLTSDRSRELWEKDESGEIPFVFGLQLQSKDFYYAMLRVQMKQSKHLFYGRETGKSFFFEKTTEGIDLNLIKMADDYAIGYIENTDTEGLQKVVSPEDAELLRNRREDDNFWIVKYTFK
jgi:hypothetical protein